MRISTFLSIRIQRAGAATNGARTSGSPASAEHGFSLVGTLIASSIAVVLATMAFEVGSEMIRTAKTAAAGTEIAAVLHEGRQLAMTEHTMHYVGFIRGEDDRLDRILLIRDDGSGALEIENDTIVSEIRPDQDIRIGDGEGSDTSLPSGLLSGEPVFGLSFGTRGDARHPTTGEPLAGFLNVSSGGPIRGSWRKFANIQISPSGSIGNLFRRVETTN